MIKTNKGLDLPISGNPSMDLDSSTAINSVAILGADYVGLKPTMMVDEGDIVQSGQKLFNLDCNLIYKTTYKSQNNVKRPLDMRMSLRKFLVDIGSSKFNSNFDGFKISWLLASICSHILFPTIPLAPVTKIFTKFKIYYFIKIIL